MNRGFLVLSIALLLGTTVTGQTGEPEILPEEVQAPPADWDDPVPWNGNPPPWFEDPATVNCGQSQGCWDALENKTAGDAV